MAVVKSGFSSSNEELSPIVSRTCSLATITDESSSNQVSSQQSKSLVPWFPSILPANVRSLRYKMHELGAVVDVNVYLPGIVSLAETWLNPSIGDSLISLSGYCSYRCDRSDGWGLFVFMLTHRFL